MTLFTSAAHRAAMAFCRKEHKAFTGGLDHIEPHQRRVLGEMLRAVDGSASADKFKLSPSMTAEQFREAVPVTDYSDWEALVLKQRETGKPVLSTSPCERYQPTSGSTSDIKWIPYTDQFLAQIDAFISPMIYEMYRKYPAVRKGSHYWSLSWVPTALREQINPDINDDMNLVPWWKRIFMSLTMAVPSGVAHTPTSDDSLFATACYLCADQHLSLISVWSPTFLLSMLGFIQGNREEIAEVLQNGKWGDAEPALGFLKCPKSRYAATVLREWNGTLSPVIFERLWPRLGLISAWDTWTSTAWAKEVMAMFPSAGFEGKGLLATEGIVTVPFRGRFPLAYRCHFLEFLDMDTHETLFSWELEPGQVVQPVLTTGTGLLRYRLHDKLEVTGFMENCPCCVFLGRTDGIDLVGEKLSPEIAQSLLDRIGTHHRIKPLSLLAIPRQYSGITDRYLLLCEGAASESIGEIAALAEEQLRNTYHYNLARDLNQLAGIACVVSPAARSLYHRRAEARGMVAGNLKIEPIVLWNCDLPPEFRLAMDACDALNAPSHEASTAEQ
ncbi:MAG: GH3 auxin-responsive promoter family protein [Thermodesulfobacteriota bacterium]|nr:GH3 auxin-responsive promoter family protein [Thermodesulfobacteriota bacterium]